MCVYARVHVRVRLRVRMRVLMHVHVNENASWNRQVVWDGTVVMAHGRLPGRCRDAAGCCRDAAGTLRELREDM